MVVCEVVCCMEVRPNCNSNPNLAMSGSYSLPKEYSEKWPVLTKCRVSESCVYCQLCQNDISVAYSVYVFLFSVLNVRCWRGCLHGVQTCI